jgi:hypothetical protein
MDYVYVLVIHTFIVVVENVYHASGLHWDYCHSYDDAKIAHHAKILASAVYQTVPLLAEQYQKLCAHHQRSDCRF